MSYSISFVNPLDKIVFIQKVLLFASKRAKDPIVYSTVSSSWRETLYDEKFDTATTIWSLPSNLFLPPRVSQQVIDAHNGMKENSFKIKAPEFLDFKQTNDRVILERWHPKYFAVAFTLSAAVLSGNIDALRALHKAGLAKNSPCFNFDFLKGKGVSFGVFSPEQHQDFQNSRTEPLRLACFAGKFEVVRFLIQELEYDPLQICEKLPHVMFCALYGAIRFFDHHHQHHRKQALAPPSSSSLVAPPISIYSNEIEKTESSVRQEEQNNKENDDDPRVKKFIQETWFDLINSTNSDDDVEFWQFVKDRSRVATAYCDPDNEPSLSKLYCPDELKIMYYLVSLYSGDDDEASDGEDKKSEITLKNNKKKTVVAAAQSSSSNKKPQRHPRDLKSLDQLLNTENVRAAFDNSYENIAPLLLLIPKDHLLPLTRFLISRGARVFRYDDDEDISAVNRRRKKISGTLCLHASSSFTFSLLMMSFSRIRMGSLSPRGILPATEFSTDFSTLRYLLSVRFYKQLLSSPFEGKMMKETNFAALTYSSCFSSSYPSVVLGGTSRVFVHQGKEEGNETIIINVNDDDNNIGSKYLHLPDCRIFKNLKKSCNNTNDDDEDADEGQAVSSPKKTKLNQKERMSEFFTFLLNEFVTRNGVKFLGPIHEVSTSKSTESLAALFDCVDNLKQNHGLDGVNVYCDLPGNYMHPPLFEACCAPDVEFVKLLVERGNASVNAFVKSDGYKITKKTSPLHLAVKHLKLDICRYLLKKGADRELTDHLGRRPIDLATKQSAIWSLLFVE